MTSIRLKPRAPALADTRFMGRPRVHCVRLGTDGGRGCDDRQRLQRIIVESCRLMVVVTYPAAVLAKPSRLYVIAVTFGRGVEGVGDACRERALYA